MEHTLRLISAVILIAAAMTAMFSVGAAATDTAGLLGDADGDGSVTITDATVIQRYDVNMIELNDTAKKLADVDRDG